MTPHSGSQRLHLAVVNPEALEYGCRSSHTFGETGGTIGGRGANWALSDRGGRIAPLHAEIVAIDGTFCLVDRSGLTRINGAPGPLGTDRIVRLADGDTVQVGPYRLNVHIGDHAGDASATPIEDRSLDDILAQPGPLQGHDAWLERESGYGVMPAPIVVYDEQVDPLLALDGVASREGDEAVFDPTHYGLSARHEAPPDRADTMVEAFPDRHFVPVVSVPPQSSASVSRHGDPLASTPAPVVAPELPDAAAPSCPEASAHQSFRESLRERSAALARHEAALLLAVDEALRSLLIRHGADGSRELAASQQEARHEEAVAMFWQTCEGAYHRHMGVRDA